MLRLVLIGAGVLTSAIAGYVAKRKFSKSTKEVPTELKAYPPGSRTRRRKARCSQFDTTLNNGEPNLDPTA